MAQITVVNRDGEVAKVDAEIGLSVMEIIRDAGYDELLALCGGSCSCATCHVYVDDAWLDKVGEANEDENELLDTSEARESNSRLSCQIEMTDALDGLKVKIAPED